jgi:acyl-CoA synthetase (AMP-forming)/AMP-acid ligase II
MTIAFLLEQKLIDYQHTFDNTNSHIKPIIPIYINKSVYSVASLFAILKLGLSYVFIDKNTPPKRVEYLLNQVNASVMIDEDFIAELKYLNERSEKSVDRFSSAFFCEIPAYFTIYYSCNFQPYKYLKLNCHDNSSKIPAIILITLNLLSWQFNYFDILVL